MSNIIIRKIKKEDIPSVANIQVQGWRSAYKGILDEKFLQSMNIEDKIKQRQNDYEENGFIVAEQDGKVIGFCRYIDSNKYTNDIANMDCELCAIYVYPCLKRNGIGTQLFNYVLNEFKNMNKNKMILWCLKDNNPSKEFYKKMGGSIIKERQIEIDNKKYDEVGFVYNL